MLFRSPAKQELALRGLTSSAGFLQAQVADKIDTRYTPRLKFKLDAGVKRSIEMAAMLRELLPPSETGGAEAAAAATSGDAMADAAVAAPRDRSPDTSTKPGETA